MKRKISKILISLLFLIIIALATVFAVKTFMPDLFETEEKYGVGPVGVEGHPNI